MQHIEQSYRGLRVLVDLNLDRLLWPAAIAGALLLGTYAASI